MTKLDNIAQYRSTDPLYPEAVRVMLVAGRPSISLLIRTFGIGYSRATRLIKAMEGDVIAQRELERYTAHLQANIGNAFELKRITALR